jgi:hypothetical protein
MGSASVAPATRTGLPLTDIAVIGLSIATTAVTFAQAPAAFQDIARRLVRWRRRRELGSNPVVSVDASGPGGRISLELTVATTEEDLVEVLSLILLPNEQSE